MCAAAQSPAPVRATSTFRGIPGEPQVDLSLPGGPQEVSKLRLEITNINEGEVAHIHVRELKLR